MPGIKMFLATIYGMFYASVIWSIPIIAIFTEVDYVIPSVMLAVLCTILNIVAIMTFLAENWDED